MKTSSSLSATASDVLIVGAGPIGLTLANLLGSYGVSVRVVERSPKLLGVPRAVALDDEGLRVIQMTGLLDRITAHMLLGYDHWLFGRRGQLLLKVDPDTREFGFPRRNGFHQPILEHELLEGLKRFVHVDVRFSSVFQHFELSDGGCQVRVDTGDGEQVLSCSYLVGADGGGSVVRRLCGIEMEGESHPEPWIVIDTENNPDTARFSRAIGDPRRPNVNVPGTEGRRRYEFMLLPEEDPDQAVSDENLRKLLEPHCDLAKIRVVRSALYTFHSRVAARFVQDGHVFLAGDAAHMMPPFQGQGMNSGIRDVAALAWRLSTAVRGIGGAALLQSYDEERRPHAKEMIMLSQRVGSVLMVRNPILAMLRDWLFLLLSQAAWSRGYFRNMGFKPKPRAKRGFFLAGSSPLAGSLLPQPDVLSADGIRAPLDEMLGHGFALLHFADHAAVAIDGFDHPFWAHIAARRILILPGGLGPADGSFDSVVGDIGDSLRKATGAKSGETLLLRPDRYVAALIRPGQAGDIAHQLEGLL